MTSRTAKGGSGRFACGQHPSTGACALVVVESAGGAALLPRLFFYRYVEKQKEPETMPEARVGKAVHLALEHALKGVLLPQALDEGAKDLGERDKSRYRDLCNQVPKFVERISSFRRRQRVRRQLVEYAAALRSDMTTTTFYARDAFYRGILDLAYVFGDGELALVDHKTGVPHPHMAIAEQLEGYAVLATAAFADTRRVWLGVHWGTNRSHGVGGEPMTVAQINKRLLPQVMDTIEAAALAVESGPRPPARELVFAMQLPVYLPGRSGSPFRAGARRSRTLGNVNMVALTAITGSSIGTWLRCTAHPRVCLLRCLLAYLKLP